MSEMKHSAETLTEFSGVGREETHILNGRAIEEGLARKYVLTYIMRGSNAYQQRA
jgi:hypothetical protein